MTERRTTDRALAAWAVAVAVSALATAGCGGLSLSADPVAAAEAAYAKGDYARAAELARARLKAQADDPGAVRVLARAFARLGRIETAMSLYNKRIDPATMQTEDFFLVGQVLAQAGSVEPALKLWDKGAAMPPEHPELLDGLARLAGSNQRLEEGAGAARRLAKLPGWEARGLLILGTCRSMMDDWAGAAEAFEQGLKLDPEAKGASFPAQYHKLLARSLLHLGKPAEARTQLREALQKGPDPEASWYESRADLQEGKPDEAARGVKLAGTFRAEHPTFPEPAPFLGSAKCDGCHADIVASYRKARHARTFAHGPGLLKLPTPGQPLADPQDPKVTHTFERSGGKVDVVTRAGDETYKVVVDFAFGTPERYLSMVGRDAKGAYRALRLSHFRDAHGSGWDKTSGDVGDGDDVGPGTGSGVRGQEIHVRDGVVRCLACHVTNPRDFRDPALGPFVPTAAAADAAIGCEGCHGPGGNHPAAVAAGLDDPAIVNVGTATAEKVSAECMKCHIVGDARSIEQTPADPQWVRSAGLTFTFSRCYTESAGALSCLTCHDPHRDSPHDPAYYEAKCLSCHSAGSNQVVAPKVCKVNASGDCVTCHMPKLPVPVLHTSLTDHFIRVRERDPKPVGAKGSTPTAAR